MFGVEWSVCPVAVVFLLASCQYGGDAPLADWPTELLVSDDIEISNFDNIDGLLLTATAKCLCWGAECYCDVGCGFGVNVTARAVRGGGPAPRAVLRVDVAGGDCASIEILPKTCVSGDDGACGFMIHVRALIRDEVILAVSWEGSDAFATIHLAPTMSEPVITLKVYSVQKDVHVFGCLDHGDKCLEVARVEGNSFDACILEGSQRGDGSEVYLINYWPNIAEKLGGRFAAYGVAWRNGSVVGVGCVEVPNEVAACGNGTLIIHVTPL